MSYTPFTLKKEIEVTELVTVHYFEYGSNYAFEGEAHDFWEFLCVDKGDVEVCADERTYQLSRSDIIFHKPNEFHRLAASRRNAPNLVVISFVCHSPAMNFFRGKVLKVDAYEREQLAQIIAEAANAFTEPLDNPLQTHMRRRPSAPFACGQLISLHLELFLLHLMRRSLTSKQPPLKREAVRRQSNEEAYCQILEYMNTHLRERLTLELISRNTLLSTSRIQQLFKEREGCGVIEFICRLRVKRAKEYIRDGQYNFTEISDLLGYSSIHYFSRQFKKLSGMTPSEYSSSIKQLSERNKAP